MLGYSGPLVCFRDLELSLEYLQSIQSKIKLMISNEFAGFSAAEITNFLRCELFVCVDLILKYPIKIEDDVLLSSCMQLMLSVFEIIVKWMQNLPDTYNDVMP